MAELVAGIGASHAPSLAAALKPSGAVNDDWAPLLNAFSHVRHWLDDLKPDAFVVIYNDHCEEFFVNRCPTFSIGVADRFDITGHDEELPPVPGHPELGWHIAREAIGAGIDLTVCQEQGVDNGVVVPLPLIDDHWQIPIVPININVVWEPRPSPARCWTLGAAIGEAIATFANPLRVVVVGTGGLSHHLVGREFGTVHPEWDRRFLEQMEHAPDELKAYTMDELEQLAGHEGVEVVQWIAMRATLGSSCRSTYVCYYPYRMTGYAVACYVPSGAARTAV